MANSWWEFLDYTSIQPRIFIRGKIRYKTKIGTLISLLSSLIILFLSGYFFYIFIENKEVIIITAIDQNPYNPIYDLSKNPYMFRMLRGKYKLDQRIAKIIPTMITYRNNQYKNVIYLETEECSFEKHFNEDWHKKLLNFNIFEFNCFKNNQINLTENSFLGERNFINLYITECYNTTENNNHCYSSEYITNYLIYNLTFLEYYIPVMEVDNNNFIQPLTNKFFMETIPISRRFQYRYIRNLKTVNYYSDQGAVFEDNHKYEGFSLDQQKDELLGLDTIKNSNIAKNFFGVLTHNVRPNYKEIYNRRITKLQTVLANVGGLIKFIMVLAQIISQFITSQMMYVDISNSFLSLNETNNNRINISNNQQSMRYNSNKNINIKKNEISLIETICPKRFFKNTASVHIIDKCRNIVKNEICIEKIMKYHFELEKLKKVIFDENEKCIFDNLRNVTINEAMDRINKKEKNEISQEMPIVLEINIKKENISKRLMNINK